MKSGWRCCRGTSAAARKSRITVQLLGKGAEAEAEASLLPPFLLLGCTARDIDSKHGRRGLPTNTFEGVSTLRVCDALTDEGLGA
jgi:hypothetical protein